MKRIGPKANLRPVGVLIGLIRKRISWKAMPIDDETAFMSLQRAIDCGLQPMVVR